MGVVVYGTFCNKLNGFVSASSFGRLQKRATSLPVTSKERNTPTALYVYSQFTLFSLTAVLIFLWPKYGAFKNNSVLFTRIIIDKFDTLVIFVNMITFIVLQL